MWFFRLLPYILGAILFIFAPPGRRYRGYYGYDYDYGMSIGESISRALRNRNRRIAALKKASGFLKPYTKLFGNFSLSNKFCDVTLNAKDKSITCISKVYNSQNRKMCLSARDFGSVDINEYFDMMCELFSWNTKYEDIYNSLRSMAVISESVWQVNANPESKMQEPAQPEQIAAQPEETIQIVDSGSLIDINNCSEAELTALPGINVVLSKKIIKFREQQRPFKSVEDFIQAMKIKPHFAAQLSSKITCNKVDGKKIKKIKKVKSERIIDI